MGRPREHDERTRAALLAAAERLIDEHGPDAASVRTVADEVGTTTRAVYSVFGSKQGLLEALATRWFEVLNEAIEGVPATDDPGADLVEVGVQAFRRSALEHPSLYRLVFLRSSRAWSLAPSSPRSRSKLSAACKRGSRGSSPTVRPSTSARSPFTP